MSRVPKSPRTPTRFPRYPYRPWPTLPKDKYDGPNGPLVQDALSGFWVPECYIIDGPFGPVDGRNGAVVDLDVGTHEAAITMEGPIPQAITPNMT